MIRLMIVDDEPLAQKHLARMISEFPGFEITDTASSGREAIQKLKKAEVDAVFLDIEMPGLSGLEVASRLADWPQPPCVVFATAYNQYALEAFETNAMDYILKPYEKERLEKALERIQSNIETRKNQKERLEAFDDSMIQKGMVHKIVGRRRNAKDRIVIDPQEVFYFHAHLSEVRARLEKEELIVNKTLKQLLEELDPAQFSQSHKSYLVNLNRIEKVAPMFRSNYEIIFKHPENLKIPLSRRYAPAFKKKFGSW